MQIVNFKEIKKYAICGYNEINFHAIVQEVKEENSTEFYGTNDFLNIEMIVLFICQKTGIVFVGINLMVSS